MTFDMQKAREACEKLPVGGGQTVGANLAFLAKYYPAGKLLPAALDEIERLQAENNALSLLGPKKNWKPQKFDPTKTCSEQAWPYASLILIEHEVDGGRKWVSKKNEPPSTFLARILNEKQGANGMWQEYLLDELEIYQKQAKRIAELEGDAKNWEQSVNDLKMYNLQLARSLDAQDRRNTKQRAALKKLGQAKRARGKALVEERATKLIDSDDIGCDNMDCSFPDGATGCWWDACPGKEYWRKLARKQLRQEKLL